MKPAPFEYHAPESVADLAGLLREHGDDAKILAGGQSLIPMLALRLTRFEHLADITTIPTLHDIRATTNSLTLGAATRQRAAEREPEIAAGVPLLARALPHIGHFQIRNRGTIGGSIAHADPASELPAVALALDATLHTDRRTIAAADFFTGTWTTALADDEVLTAVELPIWAGPTRAAVHEVARRDGDFALAGAAVQIEPTADGPPARAAIAVFGVGPTPLRATEAEAALVAGAPIDEVARLALRDADPNDDIHATADHRRRIGVAVVARALREVLDA